MNIPDEFKYDTLSELLEKRTKARPFPQVFSLDESTMMAVEEYCANHFMEALEALKIMMQPFEHISDDNLLFDWQRQMRELITKLENVEEV